jgi:hypothetical protein
MKAIRSIPFILSFIAVLAAGELDHSSRKALLNHLDQSSSEFRSSVKGLTPEQWNYKPSAEAWSIAECAEHTALTEALPRGMAANKVLQSPAVKEQAANPKEMDEKLLKMITDRSFKAKAPEALTPTRQFATPEAVLQKFEESRNKTVALAGSRGDLREHAAPHPVLKELDAYQWLLYLSGHTMRHTAQIREVKASPGFPAAK